MSTSPTIEFEQSTEKDLKFLTEKTIALHYFETEKSRAVVDISPSFENEISNWIKEELKSPSSLIFNLVLNGKKIGFAFIKILGIPNKFTNHNSFGLIQSIWIDEDCRDKHLGKQAVRLIESVFKEQGLAYYEVNYEASNKVAEAFWKKCGLTPSSVTARKFLS